MRHFVAIIYLAICAVFFGCSERRSTIAQHRTHSESSQNTTTRGNQTFTIEPTPPLVARRGAEVLVVVASGGDRRSALDASDLAGLFTALRRPADDLQAVFPEGAGRFSGTLVLSGEGPKVERRISNGQIERAPK